MSAQRRLSLAGQCARSAARERGASLIELLVVISLIGLLIGALLPSVGRSMQVASSTLCKHHLRELGRTLLVYQIENAGWLPNAGQPQGGIQAVRTAEPWFAKLFPTYLNDPAILTCPKDPYRFRLLELDGDYAAANAMEYSSYGVNSFILTSGDGSLAKDDRLQPTRPLDTLLAADIGPDIGSGAKAVGQESLIGPARNAGLLSWDDSFDPFDPVASPASWLTTRHGTGINVLTLEGGVRHVKTAEMMKQTVQPFYSDCAAGGCTFCTELQVGHYSFAQDHVFWWTGPVPSD